MRVSGLAVLCAALIASACADSNPSGAGTPRADVPKGSYYRAVSVGGNPLPAQQASPAIYTGDLVLNDDRTVLYQMRGSSAAAFGQPIVIGRWTTAGTVLTVVEDQSQHTITGFIQGDSIVLPVYAAVDDAASGTSYVQYSTTFRRTAPDPVAVAAGTYVMTEDGALPVDGSGRGFGNVLYDTITFVNGAFYKRSQSRGTTGHSSGSTHWSTYGGNANAILLHSSSATLLRESSPAPDRDSLIVMDGALLRRTWTATGVVDQRYEKR